MQFNYIVLHSVLRMHSIKFNRFFLSLVDAQIYLPFHFDTHLRVVAVSQILGI